MRPDQIRADPAVQRPLRDHHVRTIAKSYSPALFGLAHVSLRADGHYYVIDGQHRCAAAVHAGKGHEPVRFKVYRGLTLQEEAQLFAQLNANRIAVNALASFKTRVTAEDQDALNITKVLSAFGLRIPDRYVLVDGAVCAVRAIEDVYLGRGASKKQVKNIGPNPAMLRDTIAVLHAAWGASRHAYEAILLKSMAGLLRRHGHEIDSNRLAKLLSRSCTPVSLAGQIRGHQTVSRMHYSEAGVHVLRGLYNHGLTAERRLGGS